MSMLEMSVITTALPEVFVMLASVAATTVGQVGVSADGIVSVCAGFHAILSVVCLLMYFAVDYSALLDLK